MNERPIEQAADADLQLSIVALQRAAQRARDMEKGVGKREKGSGSFDASEAARGHQAPIARCSKPNTKGQSDADNQAALIASVPLVAAFAGMTGGAGRSDPRDR